MAGYARIGFQLKTALRDTAHSLDRLPHWYLTRTPIGPGARQVLDILYPRNPRGKAYNGSQKTELRHHKQLVT